MKEVIVRSCFDLQRLRKAIYAVGLVAAPCVSGIAVAEDDRFIIQVDETHKGLVMAMSKSKGGLLKQEGRGFFAAEFKGKSLAQVQGLLNNPHVKLVEEDLRRYPLALFNDSAGDPMATQVTPYAVYQSQADQVSLGSDFSTTQKVCVIDSGIAREQGETGGYNQDFEWSLVSGTNDSGTNDWFRDGGPHGTHVAGTIGAANNAFGVIGMAPGVPMHIIKVFNDSGWGYSSSLAAAAQRCADAGANIISMSLGGGGASSTEESAFNSFRDNGGLSVAAAGNDGNNARSYPAGYESVMMVGANDANNNIASFSQFPSCTQTTGRGKRRQTVTNDGICVEVTAGGVSTLSTYPAGSAVLSVGSTDDGSGSGSGSVGLAVSAMENIGSASGDVYNFGLGKFVDGGADGKICAIDRGDISFHDKVLNCENSGGIGAIIVNNVSGMLSATLGSPNNTRIPAVGTALEDRDQVFNAATASISVTGGGDYGGMSGTSMATPAVSGVAALVWSNHPGCTGEEIRSVLKDTAMDAGANGKDVYFGHGIVQAKAASDHLSANPCGGGGGGGGGEDPVDADGDGYTDDVDCNDNDASINPGARDRGGRKWADNVDNDCNGIIDG